MKKLCTLFLCFIMSLSIYAQNQKWNVVSHRDDFNDNAIYTFTLMGVDNSKLFIGYIKNDIPSKSVVRAGIIWTEKNSAFPSKGQFQIKCDDGNIMEVIFDYPLKWCETDGLDTKGVPNKSVMEITKSDSMPTREFINLFKNNKRITVKKNKTIRKFEIPSIVEAIEKANLSYKEFEDAIANEEF